MAEPAHFKRRVMKIIRNTYPVHPGIPHAKPGDEVTWSMEKGVYRLIRKSDMKSVFSTAPVDKDGNLRSSGKTPNLVGVIAQVKLRGWVMEIG